MNNLKSYELIQLRKEAVSYALAMRGSDIGFSEPVKMLIHNAHQIEDYLLNGVDKSSTEENTRDDINEVIHDIADNAEDKSVV